MDLAVKWRFFRHLRDGDDADSLRVYRWHIEQRSGSRMAAGLTTDKWKRSLEDYVQAATDLWFSMAKGFDLAHRVPIDPDGEILDGAHRVACALVQGRDVPCVLRKTWAWAPAWDEEWFSRAGGISLADLCRIEVDFEAMKE
jgi:hypothetical protein